MNADAQVMEHFPSTLTRAESDGLIERFEQHFELYGFGIFAVLRRDTSELIGSVGLQHTGFEAAFKPCVELVSFTFTGNRASERVMQKLGLRARPEMDFEHPNVTVGHRLRPHVFYSLTQSEWMKSQTY